MIEIYYNKCVNLGIYCGLMIRKFYDALGSDDILQELEIFLGSVYGLQTISSTLEIDIIIDDLFPKNNSSTAGPITNIVDACLENDSIGQLLCELYGENYMFIYNFAKFTMILYSVSSHLLDLSESDKEDVNNELYNSELQKCFFYIDRYMKFYNNNTFKIKRFFPEIYNNFTEKKFLYENNIDVSNLYNVALELLESLYPNDVEIGEQMRRADILVRELKKIRPGKEDWRKYEDVMVKILRFLFVPPFKKVIKQVSSGTKDVRRDAVLPNNQSDGFWKLIRDEFNSRHIICEFKNNSVLPKKDNIDQLRGYLRRKTVGRFGLLFIRGELSESLMEARRRAYEEDGALILILDDKDVEKMLLMHVFTQKPEEILQDKKNNFELTY